jgi:hypothetical protein
MRVTRMTTDRAGMVTDAELKAVTDKGRTH